MFSSSLNALRYNVLRTSDDPCREALQYTRDALRYNVLLTIPAGRPGGTRGMRSGTPYF